MIPDEAVEAAAQALPCLWRPARDGHPTHRFCEDCRKQAYSALKAAAPHLIAQALREVAEELDAGIVYGWNSDRQYADYFRSKADDIRSAGAWE